MEDKKRNHSWDEEKIKKYLKQSAEAEEIPPELKTENMREYIEMQTTDKQQKKPRNITENIKHWYPAVTAACLCIILLAGVSRDHKESRNGSADIWHEVTDEGHGCSYNLSQNLSAVLRTLAGRICTGRGTGICHRNAGYSRYGKNDSG